MYIIEAMKNHEKAFSYSHTSCISYYTMYTFSDQSCPERNAKE